MLNNNGLKTPGQNKANEGNINVSLDSLAINTTQQALIASLNAMNASILAQDKDKKDKKLILHKLLLAEKNPNHIANHMKALTKNWKGTFIKGPFCCFLAKGYLSQTNGLLPGRFTIFMFIPKECETICDGFKEHLEMLRRFWNQDIDEETLKHLSNTNIFLPKNVHHLEIQVEIAYRMIQELTVDHGVATTSQARPLPSSRNVQHILRASLNEATYWL